MTIFDQTSRSQRGHSTAPSRSFAIKGFRLFVGFLLSIMAFETDDLLHRHVIELCPLCENSILLAKTAIIDSTKHVGLKHRVDLVKPGPSTASPIQSNPVGLQSRTDISQFIMIAIH